VVVYKVDRLTRSLSDFAKIVDVFDKHRVSFVSVTQQFNTTTSMGRLTLNILLSFAQFEREVTGERIRDKIAASKKKGLWMGGQPALGYDIKERKLVINPVEAETVRLIFRRYLDLKSVRLLKADLDASGIVSKVRKAADGSFYGGRSIARGALYLMLQNKIYRGEIVHKDKTYPGEHEAIVDRHLWDKVQAALADQRVERQTGGTAREPSLLTGLIFDAQAHRMSPTHANKKGVRYRYYVSSHLQDGSTQINTGQGQRIPAAQLEQLIVRKLLQQLTDATFVLDCVGSDPSADAVAQKRLIEQARRVAEGGDDLPSPEVRALISAILLRAQVYPDRIELTLSRDRLAHWLQERHKDKARGPATTPDTDARPITVSIPARLKRVARR
jgi:hypothetical protein